MEYKKYDGIAYNLHVVKTDKFKKTLVKINFREKMEKKDTTYRNFLTKILFESSHNNPSKRLLSIKSEELYSLSLTASSSLSGNAIVTTFSLEFLDEKYTEKGMNKKSLSFLLDVLFNPNILNNSFDSKSFNFAKNKVIDEIKSVLDEPNYYSTMRSFEEMDSKSPLSYRLCGYLDDLNEITEESLYEYYVNMIKSNAVDIFIVGNIEYDNVVEQFKTEFAVNTFKRNKPNHYVIHNKFKKTASSKIEKFNSSQSNLVMIYKLDELTDFEKTYVMPIYTYILGGSGDSRLFRTVREEHSLCYTVAANYSPVAGLLIIKAGINAVNYKKTRNLIKKEIKLLEKGLFDESDLDKTKANYLSSYKEVLDSADTIINNYVVNEFLGLDLLEKRSSEIKKVDIDMISTLTHKIHPELIYFLEGADK